MKTIPFTDIRGSISQYVRFAASPFRPFLSAEINALQLEQYRAGHEDITYTPLLMKIIASAASKYPLMNAIRGRGFLKDTIGIPEEVDICFAMEKTYRGETFVAIPIIRSVNKKSIQTIASEINSLSELPYEALPGNKPILLFHKLPNFLKYVLLRLSSFNPNAFKDLFGTMGFSNLGKFGIHDFYPAWVNTVVFGIGSIIVKPVVENGAIKICPVLHISMNFDHSIFDGAEAGRMLAEVRELIEKGDYDSL